MAAMLAVFAFPALGDDAGSFHPVPPGASGLSPEDIVALPGTKWLIAGAAPGSDAGTRRGLSLVDTVHPGTVLPLYPTPEAGEDWDKTRFADCPGPLAAGMAPHGINIVRRGDGGFDLLVVNHHGRESIEVFHLVQSGAIPRAIWQGCVVLPANASGNSVAPLPGGGLVVTNFLQKNDPHYLDAMENGTETGNVLKWQPGQGWTPVNAQRFSGANGAEVTPDGKWLFVSEWSAYRIWKIALDGSVPPRSIHLDFLPDNLRWTDKGKILIAGQNADPVNVMTCRSRHTPCQAGFTVLEMDPATMQTRVLAKGGDDAFGGATGAAMAGGMLWISSYYADEVARYAPR